MLRIAIISNNNHITNWQYLALKKVNKNIKIELVLNCTNSKSKKKIIKNLLYYLINLYFYQGIFFKKININNIVQQDKILNFKCTKDKNWEKIPDNILNIVKNKNLDLILKFGMGLLFIPNNEISKFGFFSFHHGDSKFYRGRPAGFYEFLNNEKSIGTVIQKLSNNIDKGGIVVLCHSKIYNYSFKKTINNVYFNSTLLLNNFILKIKKDDGFLKINNSGKLYYLPNNSLVIKFLILNIFVYFKRLCYGLFFYKDWNISILENNIFENEKDLKLKLNYNTKIKFNSKYLFYSDPFFIDKNNVILEAYDALKAYGSINIYNIQKKTLSKNILETCKHSSFPSIFKENNCTYMFPEISSWSEPKIFKIDFKSKHILQDSFLDGFSDTKLIDNILFESQGIYYIFFGLRQNNLDVCNLYYSENNKNGEYVLHPSSPIKISPFGSRLAGNIVKINDKLYRLGQDNSQKYGNGIHIFEIITLNKYSYVEKFFKSIKLIDGFGPHTIDFCEDKIVLDYYFEKFSLFAGLRRLKHLFNKYV